MRKLLLVVGGAVGFFISLVVVMAIYLAFTHWSVQRTASHFKPGMTVDEVVSTLPIDRYIINVSALDWRDLSGPCEDDAGNIRQPSEPIEYFPEMDVSDEEGKSLASAASQIPLQLDRFEALDKHLRSRQDWNRLIKAWSVFIADSDTPKDVAYLRRGSVRLQIGDFEHGYRDARASCKLGNKEGCALALKFPRDKIAAIEIEDARLAKNALACEKPLSSLMVVDPSSEGFRVYVEVPDEKEFPKPKSVTRAELAEMMKHEYQGREWRVRFTFQTMTPQRNTFVVEMGRDGKVQRVLPTVAWD